MDTDFCYFCMQLPEFPIGAAPPVSLDGFDDLLKTVPPAAARYVRSCVFPLPADAAFPHGSAAARFRAFEDSLRYDIACFRAAKFGLPVPPRPRNVRAVEGLPARIEAIAEFDPLEREKKLNEFRGAFLEGIAAGNPLSREAAACYRIRLSMAWREAKFGDARGREAFRDTVDAIEHESIGGPDAPAEEKPNRMNPIKAEV